jgi:hypothetical protein
MNNKTIDAFIYYCSDCKTFVDKNHRCQQWDTVSHMPRKAMEKWTTRHELKPKTVEGKCETCGKSCNSFSGCTGWESKPEVKLPPKHETVEDYFPTLEDVLKHFEYTHEFKSLVKDVYFYIKAKQEIVR